jgi:DNA topoisomerase-3
VVQKNYLEVYIYERWSDKEIADYEQIAEFEPTSIELPESETQPPALLTEADLIALMDKHGIGTDATHAEHIETVKSRSYIGVQERDKLVPGVIGIALCDGYDAMGFEMSKPNLRSELEADLKRWVNDATVMGFPK